MSDIESEIVLIKPKTIYTTRYGAIKLTLISLTLVAGSQLVVADPSSPKLIIAISYMGIFIFSLCTLLGLYSIFKPRFIMQITENGIVLPTTSFDWDEIEGFKLVKIFNKKLLNPKMVAIILKQDHPKYIKRPATVRAIYESLYSGQGAHVAITETHDNTDAPKLCAELNGYLKKYKSI